MYWQNSANEAYLRTLFFEFMRQGETAHEVTGAYLVGCVGAEGNIRHNHYELLAHDSLCQHLSSSPII